MGEYFKNDLSTVHPGLGILLLTYILFRFLNPEFFEAVSDELGLV